MPDDRDRRRDPDLRASSSPASGSSRPPARRSRAGTRPTPRRRRALPAGTKADVARAVKAAETAFPMWRRTPAPKRGEILYRVRCPHGPAQGAPRPRDDPRDGQGPGRGAWRRPGRHRHRLLMAGEGRRMFGDTVPSRAPRQVGDEHPPAARRGRDHHAVELPDGDPVLEDDAGAGHRQHGRVQAGRPTRRIARLSWSS